MWRQTGNSFRARSTDGQTFTILETVQILDAGTLDDPRATVEGLKRLTTAEGNHVNRLSDDNFEILGVGLLAGSLSVTRI